MQRPRKEVEAALLNKGFKQSNNDHRYFIYFAADGRKTPVKTKTSHTPKAKEIGDDLLAMMARQCHLPRARFLDLIDCPLSRDEYERLLLEAHVI
jgi:hypothetical protein